jgi:hypothetical protein
LRKWFSEPQKIVVPLGQGQKKLFLQL